MQAVGYRLGTSRGCAAHKEVPQVNQCVFAFVLHCQQEQLMVTI